jgi:cytochrome oxidase Cu insertion factor (SCO1/SenC/PrrC family)
MSPDTQFVLISIDPEVDTPDKLAEYASAHHIHEPNWHLLTGDLKPIIDLQRSFEAYRGNKMNHTTSLFVSPRNSNTIFEIADNFSVIPSLLTKTAKEQGHAH